MSTFSFLEILATLSGIYCVYLQSKERILAWPFGIVSVAISAYIFYHSKLYSDLGLHIIYIFLNIFGWYSWTRNQADSLPAPILKLSLTSITDIILLILSLSAMLGYFMGKYTDAELFYLDAYTTSGSLVAQYLLAKKYLQNWLVWIAVDLVAIPVYLYKGLYFIAFMFVVYLVLCISGYINWRKSISLTQ